MLPNQNMVIPLCMEVHQLFYAGRPAHKSRVLNVGADVNKGVTMLSDMLAFKPLFDALTKARFDFVPKLPEKVRSVTF